MSENNYDGLEKLFRDKLGGDNLENAGWDVPNDDVFFNAIEQVNKEKEDRRRPIFLWLFFGLVALGLSLFVLGTQNKIGELNQEIEKLEFANAKLSASENSKNESALGTEQEMGSAAPKVMEQTTITNSLGTELEESISVNRQAKNIKNIISENRDHTSRRNLVSQTPEIIVVDTKVDHIENENILTDVVNPIVEQRKTFDIDWINGISLGELFLAEREREVMNVKMSPTQEVEILEKPNFLTASIYAGATFSSFDMKDVGQQVFSLTEYENYYTGYTVGLALTKEMGRWDIEMTGYYGNLSNHSTYQGKEYYMSDNEALIDNETVYVADISVETPIGKNISEARFSLDGENIVENAIMNNKTWIEQRFDIIGAGLGLNYDLLRYDQFEFFVGAGISFNYILNSEQLFNSKLYYGNKMMMEEEKDNLPMNGLNKTYYSYTSRLGFAYHLNDKSSFSISANFDRSINSLRSIEDDNQPKTYLSNLGTRLRFTTRL